MLVVLVAVVLDVKDPLRPLPVYCLSIGSLSLSGTLSLHVSAKKEITICTIE